MALSVDMLKVSSLKPVVTDQDATPIASLACDHDLHLDHCVGCRFTLPFSQDISFFKLCFY